MNDRKKGIILSLITTLMWGLLAIALKVAVSKVPSATIVWLRYSMAFSALFVWFLLTNRKELKIMVRPPWQLIVATLALAVNYIGFMLGVKYTSPSNAQVIIQVGPILLALAGIYFFKEKVHKNQILGFTIVVIGFLLFYSQQLKNLLTSAEEFNTGVLLTLMAAVAWAIYASFQKHLVKTHHSQTLNLVIFGLPTILYLPFADFSSLSGLTPVWWALLIFLGANTLIAYGTMSASLKYMEANKVSMIVITNPIITFIIMAMLTQMNVTWIAGEHFKPLVWAGAILFISGAILVLKPSNQAIKEKIRTKMEARKRA